MCIPLGHHRAAVTHYRQLLGGTAVEHPVTRERVPCALVPGDRAQPARLERLLQVFVQRMWAHEFCGPFGAATATWIFGSEQRTDSTRAQLPTGQDGRK